ncbi:sensor histidine kinase [Anaerocolumna xylanovorans]|uniref:Sensor_kinase_SpoOB-type, alpha-helical domain n=1 Tax=Anaerocolumna xylanovorans DSM 12503 TaxID=1121345 RepID=A0A1M7XZZ8_9FIRM|nr:GHKL domain-containing protein [Anaerocolumna xylanovorans]SHO44864.1 Sensor_kinase_SpoOB-type, alpha-helical domain [Anaerocolumna xylanovorans DSM 12503]
MSVLLEIIWLLLYIYYLYQSGNVKKGRARAVVLFLTCTSFLMLFSLTSLKGVWAVITLVLIIYDYCYDEEPFSLNWHYLIAPGAFMTAGCFFAGKAEFFTEEVMTIILLWLCLFLLTVKRSNKAKGYLIITALVFGGIAAVLGNMGVITGRESTEGIRAGSLSFLYEAVTVLAVLIFILLENSFTGFQKGFEKDSKKFREEVLKHQYEEIKNIYLNMRGWRHDYHNHLQVMKAYLTFDQKKELEQYLSELEQELNRVDAYVKSGNLMLDAILNSKLSLMEKSGISITCKTELTGDIPLQEVDLCVILGNLLDNAMEACGQIQQNERFVRVYISVIKKQFYISVQNSAKEEPDFNERNYISNKRGNHGFGIKRVKALTDKYEGFLNLQNEPGIFAAEVTLPIKDLVNQGEADF